MATEILNINAWDDGWPTGYVSNVDEPTANADGQYVSTPNLFDTAIFELSAPVNITALDTVTAVKITVRAKYVDNDKYGTSTGQLGVQFRIGGVSRGSTNTSDFSTVFTNKLTTNTGWDADWTLAQLGLAQVRVFADEGDVGVGLDPEWYIDCIDVEITYTEVNPITRTPDAVALTLTGKLPIRDVSSEYKLEYPLLGELDLTGKAPTLGSAIVVPGGSLTAQGQISYINSLTEQLQVNAWDDGWTTGYASNVDEPVSNADGQVVATEFVSGGIETAVFDFDDVSSIVDLDDVLSITMTVRARARRILAGTVYEADLGITLLIGGASQGGTNLNLLPTLGSFTNTTISRSSWNQDWSISQLNSLQVRATSEVLTSGNPVASIEIDTIDVIVEYASQSPFEITVAPAALLFSGDVPVALYDVLRTPAVVARTLTGKAVTVQSTDLALPTAAQLTLQPQTPLTLHNFIRSPAADPLVLSGQAPSRVVNDYYAPTKDSLVLTGKVPVAATTINHTALPARQFLRLEPGAPLQYDGPTQTDYPIDPPRVRAKLNTQDVTLTRSNSYIKIVAEDSLSLATYAPAPPLSQLRPVLAGSLTLTPATPLAVPSTVLSVPSGALTLTFLTDMKVSAGSLALGTYAPTALTIHLAQPAQATLALAGQAVLVENASVTIGAEQLVYTTHTPTIELTTTLTGIDHRFISLSVDRRIEFIATPTDVLIG